MDFELQIQKPLRELAYQELKHKILIGEIASETRLMEVSLAEKMNVSRTPIREAIRELAADGLVTIEPRRGAYVAKVSVKDMLDVFEVREDLEGLAASLAALRATEEQKKRLQELISEYDTAVEEDDKKAIVSCDEEFHRLIVQCSANDTLIQMVNHIQELSLRFRYIYFDDFSRNRKVSEEHKKIYDAIISGDKERAREEADAHIKALKDFVCTLEKKLP